jgi:four helix bundle protein
MLRIHSFIIDTIRLTAPLAETIARRDRDLASQYRRALSSVALNVAEGSNQRGARRASHYSIALGSAEEAFSALVAAAAWGYVPEPPPDIGARFRQIIGTLHRVAHPR